jgi:hypothetical protein
MPIADVTTAFNWPAAELSTTKDATKTLPFVMAVNAQIFCFIVAHRVSSSDRNGRLWRVIFFRRQKDDLNRTVKSPDRQNSSLKDEMFFPLKSRIPGLMTAVQLLRS